MSKTENDEVSIGIGEGSVSLTVEQATDLSRLCEHPGYKSLRVVLKAIEESVIVALRNSEMPFDQMRRHQGRSECARTIADILEEDLPEWYKSGQSERNASGAQEENDPTP